MFERRMTEFRKRLAQAGIDVALITDDDNVYYLTGYFDDLHMEFGRPTILVAPKDGDTLLITPSLDYNAARACAKVDRRRWSMRLPSPANVRHWMRCAPVSRQKAYMPLTPM